jgi:hypothetical protein
MSEPSAFKTIPMYTKVQPSVGLVAETVGVRRTDYESLN